jgi:transcriptional regulator with XRE-family HTH domain
MTQEELARRAGMSLKGMGDIERGAIPDPHYSSLNKIAEGLGVSVGELVEEPVPLDEAPQIVAWLRGNGLEWGTTTNADFREHVGGLDLKELDEDRRPVSVMELVRDLADEQAEAHDLLWIQSNYRSLGSLLPVEPDAPVAEQKRQRHDQLRALRKELDRRYRRRAYALMRYAELLAAQEGSANGGSDFEPVRVAATQEGLWDQAEREEA